MTKRTFIVAVLLAMKMPTWAQLSLDSCLKMARENYPAIKQYALVEASREFTMSNASKGYLPQVSVSGTAAAFTDPVDLGQLGDIDNTLYNIGLTVSQTIYDGGAIAAKRRTAKAQAEVEARRLDVTMYDVEARVEELFFGILVIDAQINQTNTLIDDLTIGKRTVEAMMRNGVANQSDVDAVEVEIVKARQREVAMKASRQAYSKMLKLYTTPQAPRTGGCSSSPWGEEDSLALIRPSIEDVMATYSMSIENAAERHTSSPLGDELTFPRSGGFGGRSVRPELSYYSSQSKLLDERRRSLDVGLMPRLSAFGTAMYHSKPLAVMNNSLLAAGLSLSWNIGALYTRKNDIRNIENDRARIDSERETFLFNNSLQSTQSMGQIDNLRQQLALDDDIVKLRESIRNKAQRKVELGTETVNEMLRDINAASEARQQRDVHEIQLVKECYFYDRVVGR